MKQACRDIRLLSILWETVAALVCVGATKHKLFSGSLWSLTTLPLNTKQKIKGIRQIHVSRVVKVILMMLCRRNLFTLCLCSQQTEGLAKILFRFIFLLRWILTSKEMCHGSMTLKGVKIHRKCYLGRDKYLLLSRKGCVYYNSFSFGHHFQRLWYCSPHFWDVGDMASLQQSQMLQIEGDQTIRRVVNKPTARHII